MSMLPQKFKGKNLNQVLNAAARELGCDPEELEYKVVKEGKTGLLSFGANEYVIEVTGYNKNDDALKAENTINSKSPMETKNGNVEQGALANNEKGL